MRRALCLAICVPLVPLVVACSRSELSPSGAEAKPMSPTAKPPSPQAPAPTTTRLSDLAPQRGASRLVVIKDRAGFLAGDRIVFTSLTTKQQVTTPLADAHALGVLGDDVVVAINALGKKALVRFPPADPKGHHIDGIMSVPNTGYGSIFAAGKPTELYLGGPQIGLQRCRIDADRVVPIETVDWKADEDATFTTAGNGRVAFLASDEIVRLGPDATRATFHLPDAWVAPAHLAAGPTPGSMWVTQRDQLGLLALDAGHATVTRTVALGALAYRLASAGDFAAVVVASGHDAQLTSELLVIGGDGKIRWRAKLPPNTPEIDVAATADRVAVQVGDKLLAWTAKDGGALVP